MGHFFYLNALVSGLFFTFVFFYLFKHEAEFRDSVFFNLSLFFLLVTCEVLAYILSKEYIFFLDIWNTSWVKYFLDIGYSFLETPLSKRLQIIKEGANHNNLGIKLFFKSILMVFNFFGFFLLEISTIVIETTLHCAFIISAICFNISEFIKLLFWLFINIPLIFLEPKMILLSIWTHLFSCLTCLSTYTWFLVPYFFFLVAFYFWLKKNL